MVTDLKGIGEWGYSALIEADGATILFDTGARPETVLSNAAELGIDLSQVTDVILSHHHADHTGGLLHLRQELSEKNPNALARLHVGKGIFLHRVPSNVALDRKSELSADMESLGLGFRSDGGGSAAITNDLSADMKNLRMAYRASGGKITIHDAAAEIFPGIWLTGPIPRIHPENNWNPTGQLILEGRTLPDNIPEDQALVIETTEGLVVISGCGHAGIINTIDYAKATTQTARVHSVIGGFHLVNATDRDVAWTGNKFREAAVQHVLGAHCTGIDPLMGLRQAAGLDRTHAVVGAVGSTFELGKGIRPGVVAR